MNISHRQAFIVLRSTKNMIVSLKDVGKLPFTSVVAHDKMKWIKNSTKNGKINRFVLFVMFSQKNSFVLLNRGL